MIVHAGDPRVSDAKIVWMGPEEISWVRNYNRVINGEVTVEVLIEKDTCGDAWGTTIDACLPVIDLIDIRRSTPYGIQQVKELLGISCAFEQVVSIINECTTQGLPWKGRPMNRIRKR